MAEDEPRLRARFTELLLNAPTRDLRAGFELARRLGPAAAPVLWSLTGAEKSNMKRRMTVLAAACLAEGPGGDERVLARLDDRSPMQDRLVCGLWLALGPVRTRRPQDVWDRVFGRDQREPVPLLLVTALLASSRFPGSGASCPSALVRTENPGIVAAGLYARAPVPESVAQAFHRTRPPDHASLVLRAELLRALPDPGRGDAPTDRPAGSVLDLARASVQASGEGNATLRDASALLLAFGDAVHSDGLPRPEWRLLQMYASDPRSIASLRSWLPPLPSPLDEPARTRLAVGYALSRPIAEVLADRSTWGTATAIRQHVALALALRLCATASEPVRAVQPDLPEWGFVRWASGVEEPVGGGFEDEALQQGALLADAGRLSREAAARLFEDTLWRWGSHPGLGRFAVQREFVRDLLLSGSLPGNRYQIGLADHLRYLPAGLGNENDFFWLAVELYEFLRTPVLPVPAECRLR